MTSSEMLARLRAPGAHSHAAKLAAILVDDGLARRIDALVDPKVLAAAARDALRAMTASDAAEAHVPARAKEIVAELAAQTRSVASIVPAALADGARAIVAVAMTPRHDAIMGLLDREPVKNLLRAQVVETLVAFGRRAASPVSDNAIARGIGGFSKLVASRPSALGRMASAVSGEVEKQVEKRANDFADTAVAGVLESIAEQASDPARAKDQAAMRTALLDGLLELAPSEIAATAAGQRGGAGRERAEGAACVVERRGVRRGGRGRPLQGDRARRDADARRGARRSRAPRRGGRARARRGAASRRALRLGRRVREVARRSLRRVTAGTPVRWLPVTGRDHPRKHSPSPR